MSNEAVQPYKLRPYKNEDIPFIQNSWGSSYYKGAAYNSYLSPKEFNAKHRPIREQILRKPNTAIIVACSTSDEDLILGWMIIEKPMKAKGLLFHYIYIKEAFKNENLAQAILKNGLPDSPVMITHMTDRARKIIKKKLATSSMFQGFFYAPDLIMVRDKYLNILPHKHEYEPKGEL